MIDSDRVSESFDRAESSKKSHMEKNKDSDSESLFFSICDFSGFVDWYGPL